jgi:hypothetical protein
MYFHAPVNQINLQQFLFKPHLNINPMLKESIIINQFHHENDMWKRMLGFMREENINSKNRLSEIVKEMDGADFLMLEQIEYFQNRFLEEDDKIRQLRKEVEDQDDLLEREKYNENDGALIRTVKGTQARLRNDIERTTKAFNRLKFEFNNYLSATL